MKETKLINKANEILIVKAYLSQLRGNQYPYFSITGEVWAANKAGQPWGRDAMVCGCIHEIILKHFPGMADLVALHLSDIDGSPSHAIENGFYWFGGCPEYQAYNRKTFAEYVRISETEADKLKQRIGSIRSFRFLALSVFCRLSSALLMHFKNLLRWLSSAIQDAEFYLERKAKQSDRNALTKQKKLFAAWIMSQRPRWKAEADACIKKYNLEIVKG